MKSSLLRCMSGLLMLSVAVFIAPVHAGSAQSAKEAINACLKETQRKLEVNNFSSIDKKTGLVKLDHRTYEVYYNVNLREAAGEAPEQVRVRCVSGGFAKVREFEVMQGQWAFSSQQPANTAIAKAL